MELDGHAVRIGVAGAVRNSRYSGRIGESRGRRDRAAVEQYGPAQAGCFRRRLKAAFDNDALGMIDTKPRVDTKHLGQGVNELFLNRLILSADDSRPC